MNLKTIGFLALATSKKNGFDKTFIEEIALIHAEVSEILEAYRKEKYSVCGSFTEYMNNYDESFKYFKSGKLKNKDRAEAFIEGFESLVKNTVEDELSDVIIWCLKIAAQKNIDIDWHIAMKLKYNSLREYEKKI